MGLDEKWSELEQRAPLYVAACKLLALVVHSALAARNKLAGAVGGGSPASRGPGV